MNATHASGRVSRDIVLEPADNARLANLCGEFDQHLRQIESRLDIDIAGRGNHFRCTGAPQAARMGEDVLCALFAMTDSERLDPQRVHLLLQESFMRSADDSVNDSAHNGADNNVYDNAHDSETGSKNHGADNNANDSANNGKNSSAKNNAKNNAKNGTNNNVHDKNNAAPHDDAAASAALPIQTPRRRIKARGATQAAYLQNMAAHDLAFGIGPAGTGKTYLAVAAAVQALDSERVRRIVLVRPAVEAGERLGFLPGDMSQKVDPYLRPMYDALYDMVGMERVTRLLEHNVIAIAPLAFMRGRSLNESFVILDEAQNTSIEQMKMFLTRMGFASQAVVTGDITQIDLPAGQTSGLRNATKVLQGVPGIGFTFFSARDVVRHPLVQRIVTAYEANDE